MNRRLPCGCAFLGGRILACPAAGALQNGVLAAKAVGNGILLVETATALVNHWLDHGLAPREYQTVLARMTAHRDGGDGA